MAKRMARPGRVERGKTATERLFTRLEERLDLLERKPADPHGIEARVRGVETAIKGLAQTVLHEMLRWTCEECGHKNEVPCFFSRLIEWRCGGCDMVAREDFRQFHTHRRT